MHSWRTLLLSATTLCGAALVFVGTGLPAAETPPPQGAAIRVGITEGDLRGDDHRALQAAIDYVAGLGGGTVHIGPGRYQMRNALTLRDNVRVVGVPDQTILVACDGRAARLAADGDCNQREITLADPTGFQVGDGVAVFDKRSASGFTVTTATLTAKVGSNTFRISRPLYLDYLVSNDATARLTFPVVGGWQIKNAVVEGLTIDGNRENTQPLDGCRGAGIYLFECENVTFRNCTVRNYNGDGISFQVSQRVTVEDCLCENNAGHGLHPGSGSQHPVVCRNRARGNGQDGLFVCWRVQHGLFDANALHANKRAGISIGHKDSDNLFRGNEIIGNTSTGVVFRNESEAMGAHRNRFEKNVILDNGVAGTRAAVVINGPHHDLEFSGNTIGYSQGQDAATVGIRSSKMAKGLKAGNNQFRNVSTEIEHK
jgi:parallel beta-helix repeat protein